MGNGAVGGPQLLSYDTVSLWLARRPENPRNAKEEEELLLGLFVESVRLEALDVLELLTQKYPTFPTLQGGVHPVRLASEACKAEALDQLLRSSHWDVSLLSDCLLLLAGSRSFEESALCGALLLSAGGQSLLKARGHAGESVFHAAANANNVPFVRVVSSLLLPHPSLQKLLAAKDSQGRTATLIASRNGHSAILAAFDDIRRGQGVGESRQAPLPQDMDRIMAVWERFFQNAALRMMGEDLDNDAISRPHRSAEESTGKRIKMDRRMMMMWYQFVCCCCQTTGQCYLVNKASGVLGGWLSDFLAPFTPYLSVSTSSSLPASPDAAAHGGWLTYYDPETNSTTFFNVLTWAAPVSSLPLGVGGGRHLCIEAGLTSCGGDNDPHDVWFGPDQALGRAWVQVSRRTQESTTSKTSSDKWSDWPAADNTVYYWNLLSGQTLSQPPPFFQVYEGWILCCEEGDFHHLFWYCEATGESVWCE